MCLKETKNHLLRERLKSFAPSEKDIETQYSESREKKRKKQEGKIHALEKEL